MSARHRARKRFGQHFLVDAGVITQIVDSIAPRPDDVVVEIGPGLGAMTAPLIRSGANLHAIEFDRDLAASLREISASEPRFTLHQADALDFDVASLGGDLRVVGNLPYNISTPLLFHLLEALPAIRDMHFMLQKEVVDRITAAPGSKRFGRLTIMLGSQADAEWLFDVPPDAFDPPPKVTSAVLRIVPRPDRAASVKDGRILGELVATAFSRRRKTLRNALAGLVAPDTLASAGIDPGARAETVSVERWVDLANRLANAGNDA